ncbi:MAG: TlpA family protein disulfide reductase [Bacteroidales bacterium]|nr:TlpA family protein disulfide reductase [Bacteroidales bacterium]MCF8403356.1 TlpA family protein disulfide reductase [Bacteroidales bacterium]
MKGILVFAALISVFITTCSTNYRNDKVVQMDFSALKPLLSKNNDTVYIINFWATWCKPCVDELPDFEKINHDFASQKVRVLLVSLDFPDKLDKLIVPFIAKNNIQSEVIHLTDVNGNEWINKVNPEWSGAIPATLIYKGKSRFFHEGKLSYEQINSIINTKL